MKKTTRTHPLTGDKVPGTLHECGAWVADEAHIGPKVRLIGPATIRGGDIYGGTICGGTICGGTIYGGTIRGGTIYGGDVIRSTRDLLVIAPVGSEDVTVTLARTETGHRLGVGCWYDGTVDTLEAEVERRIVIDRCPESIRAEYAAILPLLRRRLAEWGVA